MTIQTSSPPSGINNQASRSELIIVLLYAILSAMWILFSDQVVEQMFSDPAHHTLAQTLKGWLFVVVTSLLLYLLLRQHSGATRAPSSNPKSKSLVWPISLVFVVFATITAGNLIHSAARHEKQGMAQLQTIADVKARQISDWLEERRNDARFIQSSRFFAETYHRWREADDAASREILQGRLDTIRKGNNFQSVMLLDEGNHSCGALCIYSAETDAFNAGEMQLLTELADDLAYGVRTLRDRAARKQSETLLREMSAIAHIGAWIFDATNGEGT